MHAFVIMKKSYSDFDIAIRVPVAATDTENVAVREVAELNEKRTAKDIADEVKYEYVRVKKI